MIDGSSDSQKKGSGLNSNLTPKKLNDIYTFELMKPVCIEDNMMIVICRTIDKILRIVGKGDLVESIKLVV